MYKIFTKTLFVGKKLFYAPSCQSTNAWACQYEPISAGDEGALFICDEQMAGKGQRGNRWESAPGQNLTFSLLLTPHFLQPRLQFGLSAACSLGIASFLQQEMGLPAKIKWPNDILLEDKKCCGILIENSIKANSVSKSIIGIGLNVNQTDFSYPRATSLQNFTGKTLDLPWVCEGVCQYIEAAYLRLKAGHGPAIMQDYHKSLFRLGETWLFQEPQTEKIFEGCIQHVTNDGYICITDTYGESKNYSLKEIRFNDFAS